MTFSSEPGPQPTGSSAGAAEPAGVFGPQEHGIVPTQDAAEPQVPAEAAAAAAPGVTAEETPSGGPAEGRQPDVPVQAPQSTESAAPPATPAGSVKASTRPAEPAAQGDFTPYTIGDPGRAFARTVPLPSTAPGGMHDYAMDAAVISDADGTPRLVLRGASGRGLAHQQYGDPRQDDYGFALSADGDFLVAVVADGVSSGAWSHLAARLAAEEGTAHVANLLTTTNAVDIDWHGVLVMLSERMQDLCATLPSRDLRDVELTPREIAEKMATTVIFGVVGVRPDEDGTHPVTVVRLGDTSGWILDAEDGWVALGDVKNEGNVIAESSTACLPLVPEGDPLVVQTTLGAGAALLLLTDGIGDPLGSGRGEVGAVLGQQWATPPHPIEFAGQVCFGRKTFDDDRGAIGIWPVSALEPDQSRAADRPLTGAVATAMAGTA